MSSQATSGPVRSPSYKHRRLPALAIALIVVLPMAVSASTEFDALLELDMTIPSGAIHNKFGFATSFPQPAAAAGIGINNGNPGGERALFTQKGGTASLGPNPPNLGIVRQDGAKGRRMLLHIDGDTNAVPVDGSIGQAEGWLSGTAKFRLGNFTGRPEFSVDCGEGDRRPRSNRCFTICTPRRPTTSTSSIGQMRRSSIVW